MTVDPAPATTRRTSPDDRGLFSWSPVGALLMVDKRDDRERPGDAEDIAGRDGGDQEPSVYADFLCSPKVTQRRSPMERGARYDRGSFVGNPRGETVAVASYLTIPGIVEAEPLFEMTTELDGLTFNVLIGVGDTSFRLQQAGHNAEVLPLVEVVTDTGSFRVDSARVTGSYFPTASEPPMIQVTFLARSVERV